jgi:hypothetical protein
VKWRKFDGSKWLAFLCGLFHDTFRISDCIVSSGRMTDEKLIGKDLEGSGSSLINVLFEHLLTGTDKNHEIPQSRSPVSS